MKFSIASLLLLLCWSAARANVIPEGQSKQEMMPSVFPTIQAEDYSYITGGAYIYDDCGATTVGNMGTVAMMRFDNVDVGTTAATTVRIHYSNEAVGQWTKVRFFTNNPAVSSAIGNVNAIRTNDWCDFADVLIDVSGANPPIVGKYDSLYFTFTTSDPTSAGFDFDWFSFEK
ncbi:hypothetical protein CHUAL_008834 [Chamberlinius hualienensis]